MKKTATPQQYWEYSEEDILKANRVKYNDQNILKFYEDYEEPSYSYQEYDVVLGTIMDVLKKKSEPVRAVDMCGGAGKAAFVIRRLNPGAQVILVDLAEKMLEIARRHMAFQNISDIEIIEANAFSFLEEDREFDLIVFSSAVHHFRNPVKLLYAAAQKLSDHGFIVTMADPTTMIKTTRFNVFNFLITNWDSKKIMVRQSWEKHINLRNSEVAASSEGDFDVAEFQTYLGIDDLKLKQDLAVVGVKPLVHMHYPAGGSTLITRIMGMIGMRWAYSMVLYRDANQDYRRLECDVKTSIKQRLPFKISYI